MQLPLQCNYITHLSKCTISPGNAFLDSESGLETILTIILGFQWVTGLFKFFPIDFFLLFNKLNTSSCFNEYFVNGLDDT